MAGLVVPAIHVFERGKTWMPGAKQPKVGHGGANSDSTYSKTL
jgi:hypothetical protein